MMLTPEQEKLFEENENLIHSIIKKYIIGAGKYSLNDYDDLAQIARIALCKAIDKYDPNKGALSTFAYPVIRNALYNAFRDQNDGIEQESVSMSDEFVELNVDLAYNNITSITDEIMLKDGISIIEDCTKRYTGIAAKGAEAIKLTLLGYSFTDVAVMYDVEPNVLTAWVTRARQKLKREPAILRLLDKA